MRILSALAGLLLIAGPAFAAEEWGIDHEEKARLTVTVVDIACVLTGDCPENCGGGKRQLGLLTEEGRLIPAAKNFDPFAGTQADLVPFCGKKTIVDGLLIENPKLPMFAVQFKKSADPDGKWARGNWFVKQWAKANPDKEANQWFRHDARIVAKIERTGKLGIPGLKLEE
ncbi:MAG: hypothetical protein OXN81_21140 [Alphaproteobacteria bacterium]|nr:hypothetical protein [Alphaproteobacteria bacterium]